MEDERIWEFEGSLWTGDATRYHELVDETCVMVLPAPPFVFAGPQAIDAVAHTPKWSEAEFSEQTVSRPQKGLIVIAYRVRATRSGAEDYEAHCTSTLRRIGHEDWRVVQHQQTPLQSRSD